MAQRGGVPAGSDARRQGQGRASFLPADFQRPRSLAHADGVELRGLLLRRVGPGGGGGRRTTGGGGRLCPQPPRVLRRCGAAAGGPRLGRPPRDGGGGRGLPAPEPPPARRHRPDAARGGGPAGFLSPLPQYEGLLLPDPQREGEGWDGLAGLVCALGPSVAPCGSSTSSSGGVQRGRRGGGRAGGGRGRAGQGRGSAQPSCAVSWTSCAPGPGRRPPSAAQLDGLLVALHARLARLEETREAQLDGQARLVLHTAFPTMADAPCVWGWGCFAVEGEVPADGAPAPKAEPNAPGCRAASMVVTGNFSDFFLDYRRRSHSSRNNCVIPSNQFTEQSKAEGTKAK